MCGKERVQLNKKLNVILQKYFQKIILKFFFVCGDGFYSFFILFNLYMLLNHFQVLLLSKVPVEIFQACFFSKICK